MFQIEMNLKKKIQNAGLTSMHYTDINIWGGGVWVRIVLCNLIICDGKISRMMMEHSNVKR